MRRLLRIIFGILIVLSIVWVGGYKISSFKNRVGMKDPTSVYQPLTNKISNNIDKPNMDDGSTIDENTIEVNNSTKTDNQTDIKSNDITTDNDTKSSNSDKDTSDKDTSSDNDIGILFTKSPNNNDNNIAKQPMTTLNPKYIPKITIGKETMVTANKSALDVLKWLSINFQIDDIVKVSYNTKVDVELGDTKLVYDNVLKNEKNLNKLVKSIKVVSSLDDKTNYNRDEYEKPIISYKLDNTKINRNDYAWKTSKWFNEKDFTYTCPYTGTIIKDLDDKKDDKDFGTLDYDHIVPLASTYIRGGNEWTEEEKNNYAYDQWVGVDVLYSANRSKSDKGPTEYLPDINIEDYCYSWIMICSKYKLTMTKDELDICTKYIEKALNNNETVEHLGNSN